MGIGRKRDADAIARLERWNSASTAAAYGGSVEQLPAAFWKHIAEALVGPAAEDVLDASEWLLVQAARELGYHGGHQIIGSSSWSGFIAPLDSDKANQQDVLHAVFAAVSGLGLDGCEVVDLVPYEHLCLRVRSYEGLTRAGARAPGRTASLVVRGLLAGLMDLAYGGPYDAAGRLFLGTYECRQSRSRCRGDRHDEYTVHRKPL